MGKETILKDANVEYLYATINKQMANCIANENYKAGIYVNSTPKFEELINMLMDTSKDYMFDEYVENVRLSKNNIMILFTNGSYVIGQKINEGQRARRLNDIIFDAKIDKDVVNCIIGKMFIPYHPSDRLGLKMIGVEF